MNYRDVHFRLESGYKWGKGLEKNKTESFFLEITQLFIDAGWELKKQKYDSSCPVVVKGKNRLYLHPMDASGEVQEELIPEVETILSKGKTFNHYHTDNYRALYDMPDDEYINYLHDKEQHIINDLLEGFKTKRKNLYVTNTFNVIENVKEKYHLPRIQNHIGRSSGDPEWRYTEKLFKTLVEQGKFETAQTKYGTGYRTKTA